MASRNSKSSGDTSRSEPAGKGAKASNKNGAAQSERASASPTSKRSSQGGEKKSTGSKSSK